MFFFQLIVPAGQVVLGFFLASLNDYLPRVGHIETGYAFESFQLFNFDLFGLDQALLDLSFLAAKLFLHPLQVFSLPLQLLFPLEEPAFLPV